LPFIDDDFEFLGLLVDASGEILGMESPSSSSSSSAVVEDFRLATVVIAEDEAGDGSLERRDLGMLPNSLSNFFLCKRYIAMVARASVTYCSISDKMGG
jgi:hypothetical protein